MKRTLNFIHGAYRGLPLAVWLLSIVSLMNRAGTMVLTFIALYAVSELELTVKFAGALLGVYGAGAVLGTFVGGRLSDRIKPVRVIEISFISSGLAMFSLEWLTTKSGLILGMFVLGAVAEAYRPAIGVLLAEVTPLKDRARAYGVNRLAINLGFAIGPALGGYLAMIDYSWLFLVDGLTCILAGILVHPLLKLGLRKHPPREKEQSPRSRGEGSPWRDKFYLVFLFLIFLGTIGIFQIHATYPIYLKTVYGLTEFRFGLLMGFNAILIITTEMVLTHWASRFSSLKVIAVGSIFLGGGLAILPFGHGFVYGLLTVAVWTIGEMLMSPFSSEFVAARAGETNRGNYMGLYNMSFATAHIAAPVIGTWIYDTHGPNTLWYVIGAVSVICFLAFWLMDGVVETASD